MSRPLAHTLTSAVLLLLLAAGSATPSAAAPARPVLIELFTSQGCSSCPPADRLLTELATGGVAGIDVIALSYHVDYWNYIGWTDPFSAGEWSARQRRYAVQLAGGRVYTPQLVIDGVSECVGSDRREVEQRIVAAAERAPDAEIALSRDSDSQFTVAADLPPTASGAAEVEVVLYETGLSTKVGRGENARRTLANDFVVRRLTPLAKLAPGVPWRGAYTLTLDPSWRADRMGVAVLVRSTETLEILAAAREAL
jgi:hypothetical protein